MMFLILCGVWGWLLGMVFTAAAIVTMGRRAGGVTDSLLGDEKLDAASAIGWPVFWLLFLAWRAGKWAAGDGWRL